MEDEKLVALFQESRIISAADNVIFPLIKKMIHERINLAGSKFNGGDVQFIGDIAYIAGLQDLERHLKKIITLGNQANQKLNKNDIK